jgi:hypothetical protein
MREAVDCVWNVMAHAQKPDFVFRRNGRVHLNRRGRQFSRLLEAEVCASAVVMLDTACSEVVWRVLATHSIHLFPLHFPTRASPCAIRFQTHSTSSALRQIQATEHTNTNLAMHDIKTIILIFCQKFWCPNFTFGWYTTFLGLLFQHWIINQFNSGWLFCLGIIYARGLKTEGPNASSVKPGGPVTHKFDSCLNLRV